MSYTRPTGGTVTSSTPITTSGDLPWTHSTGAELLDLTGDPTYPPVKADGVYAVTTRVRAVSNVADDGKNFQAQLNLAPDTTGMVTAQSGKLDNANTLYLGPCAVVELNAGDVLEMSITTSAANAVTVQFDATITKIS